MNDDAILDMRGGDWALIERALPAGWQEMARELGAVRRYREFRDASTLLRVLLIHLINGTSLRETATLAKTAGLIDVSDVALLKRLRQSGDWFRWMCDGLITRWLAPMQARQLFDGRWRVRLVDGTTVSETGATGATWRVHYSMQLASLACDEVHVTETAVGETLRHFRVWPGDVLIGDRIYANRAGIRHVHAHGGAVIVRMNLSTLPLCDDKGRPLDILARLRTLRRGDVGDWPAWIAEDDGPAIAGRICAIKKSAAAARKAKEEALREAKRKHRQIRPETLEACKYVFVFTTLDASVTAADILDAYRARWQIELAFKRLKSLLNLGHLKKYDPNAALAWLQGKLLAALLIECLLAIAERFSPWGYPLDLLDTPMPVA